MKLLSMCMQPFLSDTVYKQNNWLECLFLHSAVKEEVPDNDQEHTEDGEAVSVFILM